MGLPTWRQLANAVLEECRRKRNRKFPRIEQLYKEGKYQDQFDEVVLAYGRDFLHNICREMVSDPGGNGEAYTELSKLSFLSYFTTNYDDILIRHLHQSGKVVAVFRNSREDLEAVDVDTTPSLVKIHGDFSEASSVVLTASDYQRMYGSGEREGFQSFLNSHLARDRILFLGYSLSDPEILHIQGRLAANLRRNVAPIALLPNASQDDVDYWQRQYNIDVVPYSISGDDHSTLVSMLKSVSDVISSGNFATERTSDEDLRKAQALYMWYRFSAPAAGEALVDALQSLIMTTLANSGGSATPQELATTIQNDIGAQVTADGVELNDAVVQLVESGWMIQDEGVLNLLPEGHRLVDSYERQFSNLIDVFREQLSLDLGRAFEIDDEDARRFAQVVLDALIDIFELRGQNIMSMLFDATPIDPQGITALLQTLWRRANTLDDPHSRGSLVGFVLNMLTNPSRIHESVLNYLATAFFCIQAMRLDPAVPNLVSDVVADRTLLIDENILIPLTAKDEDRHEFISDAIRAATEAGLSLCTTQLFVDSVRRHADWALDLVKVHGTQSQEVMMAAAGVGGYLPNAFLKGFINQDPDDSSRDFMEYVRNCFGGTYSREAFDAYFEEQLGIRILNVTQMAEFAQYESDQQAEAYRLMEDWNKSRPQDTRKSQLRIDSEVEALLLITNWDDAKVVVPFLTGSRVSFVTAGSSVAQLVRSMDLVSWPMMVASSEAVGELLTRLEPSQEKMPSFRSMMIATHFRMAGHFIKTENYRRFFRPLIANAKREFEASRDLFEEALSTDLEDGFLDEVAQEEWPRIVSGLQSAVRQATERDRELQPLLEEIERLRETVGEYEEQERKRREFIARQRREQRARRRK